MAPSVGLLAHDPRQLELHAGVGLAGQRPAIANRLVDLVDDDLVPLALGVVGRRVVGAGGFLDDRLAVPAVARQAAGEEHRAEDPVAQRANLCAQPGLAAVGLRNRAGVLALEAEVGVDVLRVGIQLQGGLLGRRPGDP